jgi:hypothetical protein
MKVRLGCLSYQFPCLGVAIFSVLNCGDVLARDARVTNSTRYDELDRGLLVRAAGRARGGYAYLHSAIDGHS